MLRWISQGIGGHTHLRLAWVKRDGWIGEHLRGAVPRAPGKRRLERIAAETSRLGPQPLAAGYGEQDGTRRPEEVRSSPALGDLFTWLVGQRQPRIVVEFGSAFGVSGLYLASGLEQVGAGHLYSFEMNERWADVAESNIRQISRRVTVTRGLFEEHVDRVVPGLIDLALVDGIHAYDPVMRQFELLRRRARPGALLLFDDIDFRRSASARMREAWEEIARHADIIAAVEIDGRLGLIEMKP